MDKLKVRGGLIILNDSKSLGLEDFTLSKDSSNNILVRSGSSNNIWSLKFEETHFEGESDFKSPEELFDKLASIRTTLGSNSGSSVDIPVGTDRQLLGYENGKAVAKTFTADHWSDFPDGPPTTGTWLAAYIPNTETPLAFAKATFNMEAGQIPMYHTGGQLFVKDAVNDDHAVSLNQLKAAMPTLLSLSYTAVGNTDTDVKLQTGITGLVNPAVMVQPTNTNAALFTISSGINYDPETGDIDFNVSALQDKEVYTYTVLIK